MSKNTLILIVVLYTIIFIYALFLFKVVWNTETKPDWKWKQICKENDKRAKFIIDCAKAANPMSDEEGEDLVQQCDLSSQHLFCEYVQEYYYK